MCIQMLIENKQHYFEIEDTPQQSSLLRAAQVVDERDQNA
jgi:hypothetical protein